MSRKDKTTNSKKEKVKNGKIKNEKVKSEKKGKSKKKSIGWTIFKIFIFTMIALVIIGAGIAFGIISSIINETETIPLEDFTSQSLTTFLYDKDGKQIGAFFDEENRVAVKYENISKHIIDAVVAIEDERFFEHGGVDIKRTTAAVFNYVLSGGSVEFGGSTITQQLIKQISQDKEQDWQRKVREWYRAISAESVLKKEQILESYLTTVYLGDGQYGIEMASRNYFAKPSNEVNIAEAAVLAALIQLPGKTNPYGTEEQKQALISRQQVVLTQMLKLGKISNEEYEEAKNYELVFKKGDTAISDEVQTYFVDAVYKDVLEDLMEQKGLSEVAARQMLYTNGLKIYTTQDTRVQNIINQEYSNSDLFYTNKAGKFMESAMVVMDHNTGHVVGLIGGAAEKTGALSKNRATDEELFKRQPGSTMKPFGAYGPAFEQGLLAPGSGIDDSKQNWGGWMPNNYYGYFNGYVTVREAIKKSMNLPAARAHLMAGTEYAFNFAQNCGLNLVRTGAKNDMNPSSLALGGLTHGVTVLELTNAYATIANSGEHIEPMLYTKVLDKDGNILLENKPVTKRAMSEGTAYLLTSSLVSVTSQTGGTAVGYIKLGNMPNAGKTGNTNDDKDQWFAGFTPYYTAAVWNGYDIAEDIEYRKKVGNYPYTSMVVYNNVMKRIHEGLEVKQFEKPSSIVTAPICRDSGLVATDACRADPRGNRTHTDMFVSGTVPTKTCEVHKMARVCAETKLLANEFCKNTVEMSFITRDYVPIAKSRDWIYMLPTQTCTTHNETTAKPEPELPSGPNVGVYDDE